MAGTKIDTLLIEIRAETKNLKADLDKVKKQLGTTGKAGRNAFVPMGKDMKTTAKLAGAVGVALAGWKVVKNIAATGSMFEDLKDSLNGVFGSVAKGDQAFEKILQFAQTTPFQIETVTQAFISLKSAGIEPNIATLQTFADAASVTTNQLETFQSLIRVMQRSPGGVQLIELNQIADKGIDVWSGLEEKLGKTRLELSEFGKTAEGGKLIMDALIESMEEDFGGQMANKMDNLSVKTSNMAIAFKELGDAVFTSGLGSVLKIMADAMGDFANAMARIIRMNQGTATAADLGMETKGKTPSENLADAKAMVTAQEKVVKDRLADSLATTIGVQSDSAFMSASKKYTEAKQKLKNLENLVTKFEAIVLASLVAPFSKENPPRAEMVDFFKEFGTLANDAKDPLEEIERQMKMIVEIQGSERLMKYFGGTPEVIQDIIDHLNRLKGEMSDVATISEELRQAIASQAHTFTNDFVNALMDGESALESFKNFAKNMVSQIISIFLQMAVVNEILNAVFGLTGDAAFATIRNTRPKAGGGTVQANTPVLVGERGAEIFVPNTGGTVMTSANSARAMGGQNIVVNQSLNFATGVVPTVRTEIIKMLPQISEVTKASVFEAATRGGQFGKALRGGVG